MHNRLVESPYHTAYLIALTFLCAATFSAQTRAANAVKDSAPDEASEPFVGADDSALQKSTTPADKPADKPLEFPESAGTLIGGLRPQDSIWLYSTRSMSCCGGYGGLPELLRWRDSQWVSADKSEMQDGMRRGEIVVYVHGNRMEFNNAAHRGRLYYEQLVADGRPPVCFIIWSWPSDRVRGAVNDIRSKAARADCEKQILADFLATLPAERSLTLIGFSFGARVITGALAHATEIGLSCPVARTVLFAPAMANHWLAPERYHWPAWSRINGLLLVYNTCDPALKRFRFSDRRTRPEALGYTGFGWADQAPAPFEQEDACCHVGRSHAEMNYLGSQHLMDRLRQFLASQSSGLLDSGSQPAPNSPQPSAPANPGNVNPRELTPLQSP